MTTYLGPSERQTRGVQIPALSQAMGPFASSSVAMVSLTLKWMC